MRKKNTRNAFASCPLYTPYLKYGNCISMFTLFLNSNYPHGQKSTAAAAKYMQIYRRKKYTHILKRVSGPLGAIDTSKYTRAVHMHIYIYIYSILYETSSKRSLRSIESFETRYSLLVQRAPLALTLPRSLGLVYISKYLALLARTRAECSCSF